LRQNQKIFKFPLQQKTAPPYKVPLLFVCH